MKKAKILLIPYALALGGVILSMQNQMLRTTATGDFSNLPKAGEVSNDSYFTNAWQTTVGARRISDKGVIVVDDAGWGFRGKIPSRTFDLESFHFSLDLSNVPNRAAMMIMVGTTEGTYCNDAANMIAIDVVKHSSDNSTFMVTVDTVSKSHAVSIEDWQDGKGWADDGAYKGRTITADDGVIDFSMTKVNSSISTIKCNEQEVTVPTSELYRLCTDTTKGYVAIGNYGGSGQYSYIINEIGDASDKVYYSSTGAFGTFKSELARLDAIEYASASIQTITDAKLAYDALPYNDLYRWDKNYFNTSYVSVGEKINNAVKAAGNAIQLDILNTKLGDLEALTVTNEAEIDAAISQANEIESIIEEISSLTLTTEETAQFNSLKTKFETEKARIGNAARANYEAAVTLLEETVGEGIASGTTYATYLRLKGALPNKYASYFSDEEFDALYNRVQAVSEIAERSVTLTHPNWMQGDFAKVITTADNTLDVVSYGNSLDRSGAKDTAGLYLQEALNVLDFSVTFNAKDVPIQSGAWFTLGFMMNPDMWVYSNGDVTDNQGIFFLINRIGNTQLQVETHVCSMASANFYDSTLSQMINIPYQEDITLSFATETRTVAGVSDTYFNMKFNDIALDQEVITAKKIKTVINAVNGVQKGYFFVASNGYSQANPALIEVKDINGFSPLADSVAKIKTDHEAPTSTTSKVTFVHGSANGKATFAVDMHGEQFVSLTVDGKEVKEPDCTISDNKIVLVNAYCNSLSIGEHNVTLTTTGGSITWTLDVVGNGSEGDNGEEKEQEPTKKGCKGSILMTYGVVALISLVGASLAIAKKKED